MPILLTSLIGAVLVYLTVLLHYEALRLLTEKILPRLDRSSHRWQICFIVLVLMVTHVVEIEVYALGMYIASEVLMLGGLSGEDISVTTYSYFSFSCYTSLGIGDIVPTEKMRLLSGIEALTGLLMIGWTASFLLVEMRERWSRQVDV